MPFDKKAYNREYWRKRQAEKVAARAALLKTRQANAARARAALEARRNGKVEAPAVVAAPRWAVAVSNNAFAVFIDGESVFTHDFKENT